jgi:monofunctional biosynthetic peptidoglycan transglycosylase
MNPFARLFGASGDEQGGDAPDTRPRRGRAVRLLLLAVKTVVGVLALTVLLILPWRWIPPPTTSFILQLGGPEDGAPKSAHRRWVPWEAISEHLPISIVAAEDQHFPTHNGFDFEAIQQVIEEDRNRSRGASTISQQLAKNMYLWPARSYFRKGLEAYLTGFIELLWPKRRILEVYMNVVEYGPGIYGAEAASRTYFGKPAASLTPYEAALLAAVLPNPRGRSANRPSAFVQRRAQWILRQVRQLGGSDYLATL